LRADLPGNDFLEGVHIASELWRTEANVRVEIADHYAHSLYQLFRAAESAAIEWFSCRTQTVSRTIIGAASTFEALEAFAEGSLPDADGARRRRLNELERSRN